MTTLVNQEINLEVEKPKKNILKEFNYYSFQERVFDLSELIKSSLDEKYSSLIGANVYKGLCKEYDGSEYNPYHPVINGVYKIAPMSLYMGEIPLKNQMEISKKMNFLTDNPLLKQDFELVVLAPLNNFAEENNIKAIDPIAFAYFKEGEHCYEENYLITLSQWF